ncbi:MAG: CHAT domain-containing protein [Bacteroidia bacterium]|nr:CHAT domain-containing protein [Bacteroidia bacterium]
MKYNTPSFPSTEVLRFLCFGFFLLFSCVCFSQEEENESNSQGTVYWIKVSNYFLERQYDSSRYYSIKASSEFLEEENFPAYVEALNAAGSLSYRLEQLTDAKKWWDSAWVEAQKYLNEQDGAYRQAMSNMAISRQEDEDMQGAIGWYRRLLSLEYELETRLDSTYLGYTHLNMGTALTELHEKDESLLHLKEALRIFDQTGNDPLENVYPLTALGKVFAETPYEDSSRLFLMAAYNLVQPYPIESYVAYHNEALSALTGYYYLKEDYDSALVYLNQARMLPVPPDTRTGVGQAILLGSVYTKLNRFEEARKTLEEYGEKIIAEKAELWNPFLASRIQYRLGNVYRESENWEKALEYYQKTIEVLSPREGGSEAEQTQRFMTNSSTNIVYTYGYIGKCELELGNLGKAKAAYQKATTLIKETFYLLEFEASRSSLFGALKWVYEGYLDVLWEEYRQDGSDSIPTEALLMTEESRSYLMRLIFADAKGKVTAGIPEEAIEREKQIRIDLANSKAALNRRLSQREPIQREIDSLGSRIFSEQEELKNLIDELEEKYPQYTQIKFAPNIFSEEQLKKLLSDKNNDYWISYWGDFSIHTFQITGDKLTWKKKDKEVVESELDNVLRQLKTPSLDPSSVKNYEELSHSLFAHLDLFVPSDKQSLVVIPDGPLNYIPFEALATEASGENSWAKLKYLGLLSPIRYQYTISPLFGTQAAKQQKAWMGFAPGYEGIEQMRFNVPEIEKIHAMSGGKKWTGREASKENFLATAQDYKLIHFAGHAKSNSRFPMRSTLEFGSNEEDKLFAWEIFNLNLEADLAILSGCETGLGRYQAGEGVVGLARAFRYAGVHNVVQSLWLSDGQATQLLMEQFYQELGNKQLLSNSLMAARINFLEQTPERFHHPYYWSNFVLVGPDKEQSKFPITWLIFGLSAFLLALLVFFRQRSKKTDYQ